MHAISDLSPAVGFVSSEIPGGGTYTLTTLLGVFIREAEAQVGPRDRDWTILGVEFFGSENDGAVPHIWYPGDCGNVAVRLTKETALNPARAIFQLAHEACHLISPSGSRKAPSLEEGFATVFGHTMAITYANFHCPIDPAYRDAAEMVSVLLEGSPSAIRDIRALEPRMWKIEPAHIVAAVPGVAPDLAERLCLPWASGNNDRAAPSA